MHFFIRLAQIHESFREAELHSLALIAGINVKIIEYRSDSPFCIIHLESYAAAKALISRSILSLSIYELWGVGDTYDELHADVKVRTSAWWGKYMECSFRFTVSCFQGSRSSKEQRAIIENFAYMDFRGPIKMKNADEEFEVFEEFDLHAPAPKRFWFGRFIAASGRDAIITYSLKKRAYISTTSMDAELALITANMALARPGAIFFDPFVGTGGFPLACAHFGAHVIGSDIDGRSIRGHSAKQSVRGNFVQYGLTSNHLDMWTSDLTNSPLRLRAGKDGLRGVLDGIVCDPPYGVREGLKVLGRRGGNSTEPIMVDGEMAHTREGFVYPKRPYSFDAMLDDIMDFAALMLVDGGRLSMWMPTANENDVPLVIPNHPCLEEISVCIQPFNRWSRRLLTYQRRADSDVGPWVPKQREDINAPGVFADDLNAFRKKYFQGFREVDTTKEKTNGV